MCSRSMQMWANTQREAIRGRGCEGNKQVSGHLGLSGDGEILVELSPLGLDVFCHDGNHRTRLEHLL